MYAKISNHYTNIVGDPLKLLVIIFNYVWIISLEFNTTISWYYYVETFAQMKSNDGYERDENTFFTIVCIGQVAGISP